MEIKRNSQIKTVSVKNFFGLMPDKEEVYSYELFNKNGMSLKIITYGATVTELKVPLKNGQIVDVVLGFDTLEGYLQSFQLEGPPYMGTTVGRFAGRIHDGSFELNGQKILLNKNNNGNSLHGGSVGFSQKIWTVEKVTEGDNPSVTLSYTSPANEENYPGSLAVEVTYTLTEENELLIQYAGKSTEDTVVNLTNHSYFNLEGHSSNVKDQDLIVNADQMLEKSADNIPTGRYLETAGSSFDFLTAKKCPSEIDNTFVVTHKDEAAAVLFNNKNNLKMTVYTDQPGVHIYVGGNCFNKVKGKENADYHPLSGICFETQNFPDAPNHEHFPSAVLKKGDEYTHETVYKFQSF
ncbi:aldose epimerase family protein [Flavobacterium sp. HJJ]|uniref:aldose epimerase family protein n=1 Tax=Flavobacterium sp. HJJ TaxID=2783792 RepID=UPI00188C103D|nr:aldose epimerase family protein [Flavobacterium sp. HJJ]MBF4472960.1 galactose mutarotase [Flavobacterium sp. HJJ]